MNQPLLHRGRLATAPRIISVRPLVREDLGILREKRAMPRLKAIRAHHHRIAYMMASKMTTQEIAEATGMSTTRILILREDPAMKQLITELEPEALAKAKSSIDEYAWLKRQNGLRAELMIAQHFDAAEEDGAELIPLRTLLPISQDFADRFGYGKQNTTRNENVDFAKMMEAAMARSGKATVIDAKPLSVTVSPGTEEPEVGVAANLSEGRGR